MSATQQHTILGAGPVAKAVAAALGRRGITPTVVTRSGTSVPGAATAIADLSDQAKARVAVADADVVYQCAQPAYEQWAHEFRPLQRNIVDGCAAADALLVVVENMYGYGQGSEPMRETMPLAATTRKGAVRAAMWEELSQAHDAGRVRAVAARASDFFGEGVTASAFGGRLFDPLVAGKPASVLGDPDCLHTLTYVPDLGEAMVRLAETPASWGSAWHVPNAATVTVREVVTMAAAVAGVEPRISPVGIWKMRIGSLFVPAARETIEMMYQFTDDFVVDHTAYSDLIGDHATSLEESIAATVKWCMQLASVSA